MSDVIDLPKLKEITFGRDSLVFYGSVTHTYYLGRERYWPYNDIYYTQVEYSYLTMKSDILF